MAFQNPHEGFDLRLPFISMIQGTDQLRADIRKPEIAPMRLDGPHQRSWFHCRLRAENGEILSKMALTSSKLPSLSFIPITRVRKFGMESWITSKLMRTPLIAGCDRGRFLNQGLFTF